MKNFAPATPGEERPMSRLLDGPSTVRAWLRRTESQEKEALASHVNEHLDGDEFLEHLLPLDPTGADLLDKFRDGLLMCRLVCLALPGSIADSTINVPSGSEALGLFKAVENLNMALSAAEAAGLRVVNIPAGDVIDGRPVGILGLSWRLLRVHQLAQMNVKEPALRTQCHQRQQQPIASHLRAHEHTRNAQRHRFSSCPSGYIMGMTSQVTSGRCDLTPKFPTNSDQIRTTMAKGAKLRGGGELPGSKVATYIAQKRQATHGAVLISPPSNHDMQSIGDFTRPIYGPKNANPDKRGVLMKMLTEIGAGALAAGEAKAKAGHSTASGLDGRAGAARCPDGIHPTEDNTPTAELSAALVEEVLLRWFKRRLRQSKRLTGKARDGEAARKPRRTAATRLQALGTGVVTRPAAAAALSARSLFPIRPIRGRRRWRENARQSWLTLVSCRPRVKYRHRRIRRLPSPLLLTPPAFTSTSRSSDDSPASTGTGESLAVKSNGGVGGDSRDGVDGWLRNICRGVSSTTLTRPMLFVL